MTGFCWGFLTIWYTRGSEPLIILSAMLDKTMPSSAQGKSIPCEFLIPQFSDTKGSNGYLAFHKASGTQQARILSRSKHFLQRWVVLHAQERSGWMSKHLARIPLGVSKLSCHHNLSSILGAIVSNPNKTFHSISN